MSASTMASMLLALIAQVHLALPESPGAGFGQTLAADEHTLVVLGRSSDSRRLRVPMLQFFEPNVQRRGWSEVARVRARGAWSLFGESLDLDGDTLVVGAPGAANANTACGAVQVFRHRDGTWQREEQLLPWELRDGWLALGRAQEGFFGTSVAISGDRVVVGVPGQWLTNHGGPVQVFDRRWSDWGRVGLLDSGPVGPAGPGALEDPHTERGIDYGCAVDIEGDFAVVGSRTQGRGARGEVLVHERLGNEWSLSQVLRPPGDSIAAEFGSAVLVRHDLLLVVGRADPGVRGPPDQGKVVYAYRSDGACWVLAGEPLVGSPPGDLGPAVAVSGDHLLVGAPWAEKGRGAVFRYSIAARFPELRKAEAPR